MKTIKVCLLMSFVFLLDLSGYTKQLYASTKAGPIFLVFGGWVSCASDENGNPWPFGQSSMINRSTDLINMFTNEAKTFEEAPLWMVSCYNRNGQLFYMNNYIRGTVLEGSAWDLSPHRDFLAQATKEIDRPIIVLGHSHGGWTAMRFIESLKQSKPNLALFTIDPISYERCQPSNFLKFFGLSFGSNPFNYAYIEPCQTAPGDLDSNFRGQLLQTLRHNRWYHYYQTYLGPVMSGPFYGEHQPAYSYNLNPLVSVWGGARKGWIPHVNIANYSGIYASVEAIIRNGKLSSTTP